ncbi:MAG: GntR family transcriptional regulator [Methylobacteriaceae bacterium]|nr:GntR family transcriptional regulator [Methylobacteriaceae bacterium]
MNALPPFGPILLSTRRARVAQSLRSAILGGAIAPGTPLVETKVALKFGVSRSSIREAIRELIEQGLLVYKPYSGTCVAKIDEEAMTELCGVRCALERHAFTLLWPHRNDNYREELIARHAATIRAIADGDLGARINAEMHFHNFAYEFCGNSLLLELWQQLSQRIQLGSTISQSADDGPACKKSNARYLRCALGNSLEAMLLEIDRHVLHGLNAVRRYLRSAGPGRPVRHDPAPPGPRREKSRAMPVARSESPRRPAAAKALT